MTDVLPRRNLPAEAEEWGRTVEGEVQLLQSSYAEQSTRLDSQNRTTAAALGSIATQLDQIQELYQSIPKVAMSTVQTSNFGMSEGWNTIATTTLVVPKGARNASVVGLGVSNLVTSTDQASITAVGRLVLNGSASPFIPGAWSSGWGAWSNSVNFSYGWNSPVTPGQTMTLAFQIFPGDGDAWPANTGSVAVLTASMTFMG